jgi:hypothetical protein
LKRVLWEDWAAVVNIHGTCVNIRGAFEVPIDWETHFQPAMHDLVTIWLSRYGDIIAEKSGLSRGWVGLIPLATSSVR